jgi:hypothetical protein
MPLLVVEPHEMYPSFSVDPLYSPQVIQTTRMPNWVCGLDCYSMKTLIVGCGARRSDSLNG